MTRIHLCFTVAFFLIFSLGQRLSAQTITTGSPSSNPVCPGAVILVPFAQTGSFTGTYTVQLSASDGSFTNPTDLPTTGTTSPLTVTIPMPSFGMGGFGGTGYKIRVINSDPVVYGTQVSLAINATPSPPGYYLGNQTKYYCQGDYTITYPSFWITPSEEGDLKWYQNEGSNLTPLTGFESFSASTPGQRSYTVSYVNSLGCESWKSNVSILVIATPLPPSVAQSSIEYCSGTEATPLAATVTSPSISDPPTTNHLLWYDPAGNMISTVSYEGISTPPVIPPTSSVASLTYQVGQFQRTSNGYQAINCTGPLADITVNVIDCSPPSNDNCNGAVDLSDGSIVDGTTKYATQSFPAGNCATGLAYDAWYKVTPLQNGTFTVTANSLDFDIVLEAYSGNCNTLISKACQNQNTTGSETLSISNAVAGTTYHFRVYSQTTESEPLSEDSGDFTISFSSGNPLPVAFSAFDVSRGEHGIARLKWSTAMEKNSSHFEIEYSLDVQNWKRVGTVQAISESSGEKQYEFLHSGYSPGDNYYRLKAVDFDGTYAYSTIKTFSAKDKKQHLTFPNPATDYVYLPFSDISSVVMKDANGQEIRVPLNRQNRSLDVRNISAGIYFLRIESDNGLIRNEKIIITK